MIAALLLFFPIPADAESLTESVADIIAGLDVSALEELTLDDMSELISQSLLVSIYSR